MKERNDSLLGNEVSEIKGGALDDVLALADKHGFRPANPAWEGWRQLEAKREGFPLEDMPWYTQGSAVLHFDPEEAKRLSHTLQAVIDAEMPNEAVSTMARTIVELGKKGGIEFGYYRHHCFVGPAGSLPRVQR